MNAPHDASRRQRKRIQTENHLAATAFQLFESQGFDAVTMEQIAAEADMAKASLYKYFPVKEALIAHQFRVDIAAGMVERAAPMAAIPTFAARMRYLLTESAAWHTERRVYLAHYLRYLTSQAQYDSESLRKAPGEVSTRQILTHMFQAGQAAGEIATQQSAAQIACSFEYLLFGATAAWLADPSTNLTQRFLAAFELCMHGVATSPVRNGPHE